MRTFVEEFDYDPLADAKEAFHDWLQNFHAVSRPFTKATAPTVLACSDLQHHK